MIGLANRIRAVGKVIRAPEQSGLASGAEPFVVSGVALVSRISRFMNDADDTFALHSHKIWPHQVVMRHVDDAVVGERTQRSEQQREQNASKRFHATKHRQLRTENV